MRGIEHLPATGSAETVNEILKRDGAVIVDNLVEPQAMDAIAAELQPWLDATPFGPDSFSGRRTRRTGGLVARSPLCRDLVMHPLVLAATGKLLDHSHS